MKKSERVKDKPLFYITSPSAGSFLSGLKPGRVVRGRVVQLLPPDKAIVRIRGFHLLAENRGGLKEKERFEASVDRVGPPLTLTLLVEEESISKKLKEIGIKPTRFNRTLAQALLSHHLPLNRKGFEDLLSLWEGISSLFGGREPPERLWIALLLKKMRIPPTSKLFTLLQEEDFLIGEKLRKIIHHFPRLDKAISQLVPRLDDPELPIRLKQFPQEMEMFLMEVSSFMRRIPPQDCRWLRESNEEIEYIRKLELLLAHSQEITYRQIPIEEEDKFRTLQVKFERRSNSDWLRISGEFRAMGRVELEVLLLDGEKVLLRVWVEREEVGSLFEKGLPHLEERLGALGLQLTTPLIWQKKITLSPLFFLGSPWEGEIDIRG